MSARPLWIAGRFLTRLPFPATGAVTTAETGRSVPWYPFVGFVLGALIALGAAVCAEAAPVLGASLVLILWAWSSGGLHLDGLADSTDAWIGGLGSRERTLEIMKDPRSGPAAVTAIGLVLIAKWSGLQVLIESHAYWLLLAVPMLARAQLPLVLLTMRYARTHGMAADQFNHLPRRAAWLAILMACCATVVIGSWLGLVLVGAALVLYALARRTMHARIGGFTGDTAGALVEITETVLLLICALMV